MVFVATNFKLHTVIRNNVNMGKQNKKRFLNIFEYALQFNQTLANFITEICVLCSIQ